AAIRIGRALQLGWEAVETDRALHDAVEEDGAERSRLRAGARRAGVLAGFQDAAEREAGLVERLRVATGAPARGGDLTELVERHLRDGDEVHPPLALRGRVGARLRSEGREMDGNGVARIDEALLGVEEADLPLEALVRPGDGLVSEHRADDADVLLQVGELHRPEAHGEACREARADAEDDAP